MAFSNRVTPWSDTIRDSVTAVLSIGNIEDPTEAPALNAGRGEIVGIVQQLVHTLTATERSTTETFVDLFVSATIALPIADRVPFLTGVVIEAIRKELGGTEAGTSFGAIAYAVEHNNGEVLAAISGVNGETPLEYNDKLKAYFTPAKIAELTAAATPTPNPVPAPVVATPPTHTPGHTPTPTTTGGGGTGHGAHGAADGAEDEEHPDPPEDDEETVELTMEEGEGRTVYRWVKGFLVAGVAAWGIGTAGTMWLSTTAKEYIVADTNKLEDALGDYLVYAAIPVIVGTVLVLGSRLLATKLDHAKGDFFVSLRQGDPLYFFHTFNLLSIIAAGLTVLLLAGVTGPTLLNGGSPFVTGGFVITTFAILMWGEETKRYFKARWTIIKQEVRRSSRQRKLAAAETQFQKGNSIFWGLILVSLAVTLTIGYGTAAYRSGWLDKPTSKPPAVAQVAAVQVIETAPVVETPPVVKNDRKPSECEVEKANLRSLARSWNKAEGNGQGDKVSLMCESPHPKAQAACQRTKEACKK